jgi:hypothetical protein
MAESERLRGSKPPVTNYKVGDGSVKDLFRYILGEDLEVKKIRPKQKQTKVAKKDKETVRQMITSGVRGSVEATAPNPFGATKTQFVEPTPPFPVKIQDDFGAVPVPPPGEVIIEDFPEPLSEDDRLNLKLQDEFGVLDRDQTYRMGMNPRENPVGTFAGETEMPPRLMQSPRGMYGGGKVKKRKKKVKKTYGKSYNY